MTTTYLLLLKAYYCFTGVKHCERFLSTLAPTTSSSTVTYADDMVQENNHIIYPTVSKNMCQVRAAIVAMFRRAKFYNKIFTPIGEDQVTNNINTCNTHCDCCDIVIL